MQTETKEHWLCREARTMTINVFNPDPRQRIIDTFLASLGLAIKAGSIEQVRELHSALLAAEKIIEERIADQSRYQVKL